ncbi:MAG: hypothetical protein LM522_15445 [Candidatus Contendobacter sp.]|nr:hypothetical protein [Candidatus Contendobacter sp.]
MTKRDFLLCAGLALCLAPAAFAKTKTPVSPCPPSAKGYTFPQWEVREGTLTDKICNGVEYEVLESAKTGPLRKGIGTADPQATLDVNGAVKLGNDKAPCTSAKAGTLRWTGKVFQGCDGAAWRTLNTAGE